MSNTRVQVRDLPTARLGTAPAPRDTFTQVSQPIPNREAENLIDALGFFNRNLSGLGTAMRQKRQKDDEEAAQRQSNQIHLSTAEQKAEISRTGMIGGEPLANVQLKKMAGTADGSPWSADTRAWLATQNLAGMDVEDVILKRADEYLKGVSDDPAIRASFLPYVSETIAWAKQQQTSQGLQEREDLAGTTTFQFLKTKVGEWVEQGVSPEQLHANVRQLYGDLGVGRDRVTTTKMMDGNVMAVASQLVDSNPEAALAILMQDRTDESGKPIGSFADDPAYTTAVSNIVERGRRVKRDQETTALFGDTRRANFERVVQGGNFGAFQTVAGPNGKELKAEEQKTQLTQDLQSWTGREVAAGRMTEAQGRAEVRRYTARMGIDNPLIKDELDGLERRYSTADALSDPNVRADLEKRMALLKEYKEDQRQALYKQLSEPTRDFAEAFDLHKRYLGSSTEAAFEFANQVVNPANGTPQSLAYKRGEIASGVEGKLRGVFSNDSMAYTSLYGAQVEKLADLYVRGGMNVDMAIDAATEAVFERTPNYGGDPLMGLEGQGIPEDYQEVLGQMAEDYTVLDARGRRYEGTPTFFHLGGGIMAMRDRETGQFLEDENGSMIAFNLQHLRKVSNDRAQAKAATAARSAAEQQQRNRDATVHRTERMSMTPEEQRAVVEDRVVAPARTFMDFLKDTLGGRD